MMKYNAVYEVLADLTGCELMEMWNELLEEEQRQEDYWLPMDELDDLLNGLDPWEILRSAHFGEFNPCDDYFRWNAYGNLESTDYPENDIDLAELTDYIVDNDNDFSNDDIREALDGVKFLENIA